MKKIFNISESTSIILPFFIVGLIVLAVIFLTPNKKHSYSRGYKVALTSDLKNAYTFAQAYLSDLPDGRATAKTLKDYGIRLSPGVIVEHVSISKTEGNIKLRHEKLTGEGTLSRAMVDFEGTITYYP
ncbi:MAG: hypothetical protein KAR06_11420 [Deltaproteobacteria bacterium]|nr:hypothetical protein [Deltaproteobacteria bacterium]